MRKVQMIRNRMVPWGLLCALALAFAPGCQKALVIPDRTLEDPIEQKLASTGWPILGKSFHRVSEAGVIEVLLQAGLEETLSQLRKEKPVGASESGIDLEKGEHAWEFVYRETTITVMGKQQNEDQTLVYVEVATQHKPDDNATTLQR